MASDKRIEVVKAHITTHHDFPKPGIVFRNILPVLNNASVFKHLMDVMTDHLRYQHPGVEVIIGLESRGLNILPVLNNASVFKHLMDVMTDHLRYQHPGVEVIIGLESRGFLFGPIIAQNLCCGFAPIRKKGKLPGETAQVTYSLEYGTDCFEIQKDAVKPGQKVVVVDDLLATGGTMKAAFELLESVKADILEGLVVIELADLNGRQKSNKPITSLIQY